MPRIYVKPSISSMAKEEESCAFGLELGFGIDYDLMIDGGICRGDSIPQIGAIHPPGKTLQYILPKNVSYQETCLPNGALGQLMEAYMQGGQGQ